MEKNFVGVRGWWRRRCNGRPIFGKEGTV